jgi:serine/threonine-protein phosphatase CPPED1
VRQLAAAFYTTEELSQKRQQAAALQIEGALAPFITDSISRWCMKIKTVFLLAFLIVLPSFAQEPVYFMMLTDPQFGMYTNNQNFVQETANFEFAVATVNRLKPAFVVVLGDMINKAGDAEQIKEYFRISKKIDASIPVYLMPGNHDVGQAPTTESIAAYRKDFGRDYYSFQSGSIYGIVLDSALISEPKNVASEYRDQLSWLKKELETAKASGAQHIVVFQHHPYFINEAQEKDQSFNLPNERRKPILDLLHSYGVHYVFAGHTHKNSVGKDGDLEMVANCSVGMPFGEDGSGIRLAAVTPAGIQHRYFDFGKLPSRLTISTAPAFTMPAK